MKLRNLCRIVLILLAVLMLVTSTAASQQADPGLPPGQEKIDVLIGIYGNFNHGLITESGGEISQEFTLVKVIAARLPKQAIDALSNNPNIRFIEPDSEIMAVAQNIPWGIDRIFGPQKYPFLAWQQPFQHSVSVAVLDTGIDQGHEDLPALLGGTTTIDTTYWGSDVHGHGTHVAGTISALNNSKGVVGVVPGIGIYSVKVMDDAGRGTTSSLIAGLQWVVNNNIKVANMSLGTNTYTKSLHEAVDAAYAKGTILVASAGNTSGGSVLYPAAHDSVIAVSASTSSNTLASFSSIGEQIEFIAPGASILSTIPGNNYSYYNGTSMAAPHVAGAAALTWSVNSSLTNSEVRQILRQTAQDLGLPANHQGYGLVRADLAVAEAVPAEPEPEPEPFVEPDPEPITYTLKVSVTGKGSVSPSSGSHLYEENSSVAVSAIAASGWAFESWEGAVDDPFASDTTVLLDADKEVKAVFAAIGPDAPVLRSPADDAIVVGTSITFSWYKAAGANRYQIELIRAEDESVFRTVILKNVASCKVSKMPNDGTEFMWRVRAGNSLTWGGWSEYRSFTNNALPPAPALRAPANDALVVGTTITFSWYKAARGARYQLEMVNTETGEIFRTITLRNVSSYRMSKMPNKGIAYSWRIRAGNNMGWGDWSESNILINNALPPEPVLTSPGLDAAISVKTITFRWNAAARATGYQLEVINSDTGEIFKTVNLGKGTSSKQSGFRADGTAYSWRVRARNPVGFGPWSEPRPFTN
jgi:subtilisin